MTATVTIRIKPDDFDALRKLIQEIIDKEWAIYNKMRDNDEDQDLWEPHAIKAGTAQSLLKVLS